MNADPNRLRPNHAPTPFTAAEIRDGCQPGRTIRILVAPAGTDPLVRVNRFAEADEEGAWQEVQRFTVAGEPVDNAARVRSTWLEFQEHASFPAAVTTIDDETIDIPAGRFDCLRYTVRDEGVRTFWFATELPGMPVKVEERVDGRLVFEMTVIENVPAA